MNKREQYKANLMNIAVQKGMDKNMPPRRILAVLTGKNKCAECGKGGKLTVDHILPLSRGGNNKLENLQLMCEQCNKTKSNSIIGEKNGTVTTKSMLLSSMRTQHLIGEVATGESFDKVPAALELRARIDNYKRRIKEFEDTCGLDENKVALMSLALKNNETQMKGLINMIEKSTNVKTLKKQLEIVKGKMAREGVDLG